MSREKMHKHHNHMNEEYTEEHLEAMDEAEQADQQEYGQSETALNPEECKAVICPSCDVFKEAEDIRIRSLAEMENFKKRLQKEKDEQMAYAAESVLADLLPTLDNLDLALQYGSKNEACKDTIMGVEMTRKLLLDAVKKHGLEPIGAAGEPFNPEYHEAIAQADHAEIPAGHLVSVMQKGYLLKGRLLRSAKVTVCKTQSPNSNIDTTV